VTILATLVTPICDQLEKLLWLAEVAMTNWNSSVTSWRWMFFSWHEHTGCAGCSQIS